MVVMMKLFWTVVCILAVTCPVGQSAPSEAPVEAPAPASADCNNLIFNMMDCMNFLSKDSDETTPQGTCCSGFETVLKANADCICYALSNSASLGIDLNMTKAAALPSACGVTAPPLNTCNMTSTAPATSPANPPSASAPPASDTPIISPTTQSPAAAPGEGGAAPSPATPSGRASQSPAPSPHSGAYAMPAISSSLAFAVVLMISFVIFNA